MQMKMSGLDSFGVLQAVEARVVSEPLKCCNKVSIRSDIRIIPVLNIVIKR